MEAERGAEVGYKASASLSHTAQLLICAEAAVAVPSQAPRNAATASIASCDKGNRYAVRWSSPEY